MAKVMLVLGSDTVFVDQGDWDLAVLLARDACCKYREDLGVALKVITDVTAELVAVGYAEALARKVARLAFQEVMRIR